ncbi:MAG: hypothetical protein C4326_01730 [Ignavibacteria bacterium]
MKCSPILLALAVPLLFMSCAPRRAAVVLDTAVTTPDLLRAMVEENARRIVAVSGSGVITFDSPELAGSAGFESALKKPDSLLITLEGPFGIDVGTVFLCKDTYVVYNSMENSLLTGSPTTTSFRSFLPFDLTYEQILSAFSGVFPPPDREAAPMSYTIEDEQFVMVYRCRTRRCTYVIDPHYLVVTRYEVADDDGTLLLQARASSLSEQSGLGSARRIRIWFPRESCQVSIAFNRMKLNPDELDFRFTIPSNARRIERGH